MNIKPLYIAVPGHVCEAPCAYCLSRQYALYPGSCLDETSPHYTLCKQDFYNRMSFARDNGYNALFLIGDCKPQENRAFLERVAVVNSSLNRPYRIVELTTSGRGLNRDYLYFLRSVVGLTTIDLNIASFDDKQNQELAGMVEEDKASLGQLISYINGLRFNIHLHIFLSDYYDCYQDKPEQFFKDCKVTYGAHYISIHSIPPINNWLSTRRANPNVEKVLRDYVQKVGTPLDTVIKTPYNEIYSMDGLIVIAGSENTKNIIPEHSLIIQPNGRLYSWAGKKFSLIF